MASVWNILAPVRTGVIKLAGSGNQLFGTVIRHGFNDKTVTVRVTSRKYQNKYKYFIYNNKNKQVHDEYNYCTTGDKVIIKSCEKMSKTKAYYVKSIVKAFPRTDYYQLEREKQIQEAKQKQLQQIQKDKLQEIKQKKSQQ